MIDDHLCQIQASLGLYRQGRTAQELGHAQVFEWVICSDSKQDSHRFMDIVEEAISQEEIKRYKVFTAWAKEIQKKARPKNPLAKKKSKKAKQGPESDDTSLVAAIRSASLPQNKLAIATA